MASVIPVHIPQENVNDETVKIIHWLVADGDSVETDQSLVEVETSKSTFEIQAPASGVVQRIAAEDLEVPVGKVLCYVGESLAAIDAFRAAEPISPRPVSPLAPAVPVAEAATAESAAAAPAVLPPYRGARFSRSALELMRCKGLDESRFQGRGLIRQSDVLAHLGQPRPLSSDEPPASESAPRGASGVPVRAEPLPRSKRLEARLVAWSQEHAIRSAVTVAVPTRGLAELKRREPAAAESFSAAVIFESARLLKKYAYLNAYASDEQAFVYEQVNVGYALDAGRGLKVPVLRGANEKTMPELIAQRRQYLIDYLNDALRPAAMAGATFTVTDLSAAGVFSFDPLMVEGQSAILGIGAEFEVPGMTGGAYNLILAFDHRLVEGLMAAQYLGELKDRLQAHEEALAGGLTASPAAEPCCSRCLVSLSEIERMQGYLLQTAGPPKGGTRLICSFCLAGF